VQLLSVFRLQECEVANAGHFAVPAYGLRCPEAGDLGEVIFPVEEALDAVELDQDGETLRGGGETETQEEISVLAEGGTFYVDRVVALAHEAGPALPLLLAAFDGGRDERPVGLVAQGDQVEAALPQRVVDEAVQREASAGDLQAHGGVLGDAPHVGLAEAGDEAALGLQRPGLAPEVGAEDVNVARVFA
jgi:hypothetical protein